MNNAKRKSESKPTGPDIVIAPRTSQAEAAVLRKKFAAAMKAGRPAFGMDDRYYIGRRKHSLIDGVWKFEFTLDAQGMVRIYHMYFDPTGQYGSYNRLALAEYEQIQARIEAEEKARAEQEQASRDAYATQQERIRLHRIACDQLLKGVRWKKQTIRIVTNADLAVMVKAYVHGVWAVHKSQYDLHWSITHIPSGRAFGGVQYRVKREAQIMVMRIVQAMDDPTETDADKLTANPKLHGLYRSQTASCPSGSYDGMADCYAMEEDLCL